MPLTQTELDHEPLCFAAYGMQVAASKPVQDFYENFAWNFRRQLQLSDFLQRREQRARLKQQLDRLRQLGFGWDSYEAEPPNDTAYKLAEALFDRIQEYRLDVTKLVPAAEGGIGICFVEGQRYAHIEASNDGDLTLLMMEGRGHSEIREINGLAEAPAAIRRIREYLGM
jgi:hypothetical protein